MSYQVKIKGEGRGEHNYLSITDEQAENLKKALAQPKKPDWVEVGVDVIRTYNIEDITYDREADRIDREDQLLDDPYNRKRTPEEQEKMDKKLKSVGDYLKERGIINGI